MRRNVFLLVLAMPIALPLASLAGDGVVALQAAEPSCRDDSPFIYRDCENGTVTDNRTGLVWLANANCLGPVDWNRAMDFVAGLADYPGSDSDDCGLSDGSSPGEWRLPTRPELNAMIADGVAMSCNPNLTSDLGIICWSLACVLSGQCSFFNVEPAIYWSATTHVTDVDTARVVSLEKNTVFNLSDKASPRLVWPVRGGQ